MSLPLSSTNTNTNTGKGAQATPVPPSSTDAWTLTLVGSGVSTAIPVIGHFSDNCACADALRHPNGPNRRNNVSLLITVPSCDAKADARHILIDCGKTFRDAYFRVLAPHRVRYVDALLLTHDHADATGGLDDLRDLQRARPEGVDWIVEQYIPTYAMHATFAQLREQVGYILRNSRDFGPAPSNAAELKDMMLLEEQKSLGPVGNIGIRRATALDLFTLPSDVPSPFVLPALGVEVPLYTVPVEHGAGYMALGFVFGRGLARRSVGATADSVKDFNCVAYLSDVSAVPPASMAFLKDLVKIDVLFVDLLYGPGRKHATHYCMDDVIELVAQLQPIRTYGIGMYCEVEHENGNKQLQERLQQLRRDGRCGDAVQSIELGYDGFSTSLRL